MAAIDSTANSFIGKGYVFPFVLNSSGRPDVKTGKDLLEASMKDILSWALGTRYMLGQYGGGLERLLQEPNDTITQALVKHYTVDLITQWEKRLKVLDVLVTKRNDTGLYLKITYNITNTKITDSFIFPYYSQLIY